MSSNSDSDIEMQSALPKKATKKMPKSPSDELLKKTQEPKRIATKDMIRDALTVLNTRKGVSLYAIKKFITEKYSVNTDKINYLIKKSIKSEVENGFVVQTKGVGASGSFKLAPKKKKEEKPIKKKVAKITKTEKSDKLKNTKKEAEKVMKGDKKVVKKKDGEKTSKKGVEKKEKVKKTTEVSDVVVKKAKSKMAKEKLTPTKKRAAMMKRKSIGSLLKPPKMKPKAR